jgi:hypothetical protein
MEFHRLNKCRDEIPQIDEVVLIVGEEKNRGKWLEGRVIRHVKGKDGIIRGAILLHKGNCFERPIQLLYPLEIRSTLPKTEVSTKEGTCERQPNREKRQATKDAEQKIRESLN